MQFNFKAEKKKKKIKSTIDIFENARFSAQVIRENVKKSYVLLLVLVMSEIGKIKQDIDKKDLKYEFYIKLKISQKIKIIIKKKHEFLNMNFIPKT